MSLRGTIASPGTWITDRGGLPSSGLGEAGVAAEFLDVEPSLLEARRKGLFGKAEI